MPSVLPAVNSTANVIPNSQVSGDLTTSTASSSQDRFLKLLVSQMKNQDPLNPMDNAQVTSQLAQISTVSGIDKLNASINSMSSAMAASSSLQNVGLIGHSVVFPGSLARFDGTNPVPIGIDLAADAQKVTVSVIDKSGNVAREFAFGALPQGTSSFEWDGQNNENNPLPAGDYALKISASGTKGEKVTASTLMTGVVDSVSVAGASSSLNLRGLGAVDVAQVKRID